MIDHDGPTAVAGYPWFGEWSRDLMTSYEGLFLSTGRAEEGREALRRAAATLSEGMLANTADTGTLEYNTVDGTLWFVHALGRHVEVTGDEDLGSELAPALVGHRRAAPRRHPLRHRRRRRRAAARWRGRVGADVDGRPHRRRAGDAADRQAGRSEWVVDPGPRARGAAGPHRSLAPDARDGACVVRRALRPVRRSRASSTSSTDRVATTRALRPNQLLAVSLPGGPLAGAADRDAARAVVEACAPLVTPLGLRSLAPDDPAYRPRHRGSPAERDCGLPPGHRLAVADRAVRRRRPPRRRADRRPARGSLGPPRRVGARLGLGDGGRSGAARCDRLPVPGLVGRRAPPHPSRRCVDAGRPPPHVEGASWRGHVYTSSKGASHGRRDARQTLCHRRERDALRRCRLLGDAARRLPHGRRADVLLRQGEALRRRRATRRRGSRISSRGRSSTRSRGRTLRGSSSGSSSSACSCCSSRA